MKIEILYENKLEDTKSLADFLAHQINQNGNILKQVDEKHFDVNNSLKFDPELIIVVAQTHTCKWPCYFHKTAKYLKKRGKITKKKSNDDLKKVAVFNCNEPENYNCKIKKTVKNAFPNAKKYYFPTFNTNYFRMFID